MRIFLAIETPQDIKEKLAAVQEELRPLLPDVRWEDPQKLHLTVVFLGRVPDERVADLEKTVRKGIKGIKARLASASGAKSRRGINVEFSEVGVFPKKRPRVVLVEVGKGREEIEKLQKRLAEALVGAGFVFAKLSRPHVTLGRFKKGVEGTKGIKGLKGVKETGSFAVGEVVIVESKLHSQGAIHTPLVRVPLC